MLKYEGKKILVLGGASVHVKLIIAAKELGAYVIVTDNIESENSPGKQIADESWMLNIYDVDEIINQCKEVNIDGVISGWLDPCQRPYQQICEGLQLPCYGTKEQFFVMSDKNAFKEYCLKHGVDIIPTYTVTDMEENKIQYPVMIKPVDSRGSRGQAICTNKEELVKQIPLAAQESSNGEVIIEKYMGGKQDFTMTYFVINKEPYLIRTADRYLGNKKDNLDRQSICSVSPSKYSDMYLKNVDPKIRNMIAGMHYENGPLFMQGFIDEDTVRFYDPGLRFPGAEYERLFKTVTNADVMKMMVEYALSGKVSNEYGSLVDGYRLKEHHSVQLLVTARAGQITVFDGLDEIEENPYVVTISKRYEVGDVVPNSGNVSQRICEIVVMVPPTESMEEIVKWVQSKLIVLDENNENMLVSQIDITKVI